MNRRDACAGPLFATDSEEGDRSHAYGDRRGIRCGQKNKQGRGSICEWLRLISVEEQST